mgnify:CR=1 FL=1
MYQVTFIVGRSLFVVNVPKMLTGFVLARILPNARLWSRHTKGQPLLMH